MASNLTHLERVNLVRRCAGRLQADTDPATRWFGQQITLALATGRSLDEAIGIRPVRGSRATAAEIIRREQNDFDICRLVDELGVVSASKALRGQISDLKSDLAALQHRLQAEGVGNSPSAVSRAVGRVRHKR